MRNKREKPIIEEAQFKTDDGKDFIVTYHLDSSDVKRLMLLTQKFNEKKNVYDLKISPEEFFNEMMNYAAKGSIATNFLIAERGIYRNEI